MIRVSIPHGRIFEYLMQLYFDVFCSYVMAEVSHIFLELPRPITSTDLDVVTNGVVVDLAAPGAFRQWCQCGTRNPGENR